MDPVTIFQTVGCALALIDFAGRLLSHAYKTYTSPDGLNKRYVELSVVSSDLKQASNLVREKIPQVSGNESDRELARLCEQSLDDANEIERAVEQLRAHGTSRLDYARSCFVVTAKSLFRGNRVQELERQLQQIRAQVLMAAVLSNW